MRGGDLPHLKGAELRSKYLGWRRRWSPSGRHSRAGVPGAEV